MNGTSHTYTYGDGDWKDLLTAFDGQAIAYDANGVPFSMLQNRSTMYYYITNIEGDVIRLVDCYGNIAAMYKYDPFGREIYALGSHAEINPLRYRGYYYDAESKLYYVSSRYYDPEVGRFISADGYASTGQGFVGYNMFAYCNNNPVNLEDYGGTIPGRSNMVYIEDGARGDGGILTSMPEGAAVVGASVTIAAVAQKVVAGIESVVSAVKTVEKADTKTEEREQAKAEALSETQASPPVIYRYGGTNPGNLTPSKRDVDAYPSTGKGLSFSTIPKVGSAMTTIEAINATGVVYAIQDGPCHVSVHPIGGTLEDWHNAGSSSVWTMAVKSVVIKWNGRN